MKFLNFIIIYKCYFTLNINHDNRNDILFFLNKIFKFGQY